jgi:hypothetical protein
MPTGAGTIPASDSFQQPPQIRFKTRKTTWWSGRAAGVTSVATAVATVGASPSRDHPGGGRPHCRRQLTLRSWSGSSPPPLLPSSSPRSLRSGETRPSQGRLRDPGGLFAGHPRALSHRSSRSCATWLECRAVWLGGCLCGCHEARARDSARSSSTGRFAAGGCYDERRYRPVSIPTGRVQDDYCVATTSTSTCGSSATSWLDRGVLPGGF